MVRPRDGGCLREVLIFASATQCASGRQSPRSPPRAPRCPLHVQIVEICNQLAQKRYTLCGVRMIAREATARAGSFGQAVAGLRHRHFRSGSPMARGTPGSCARVRLRSDVNALRSGRANHASRLAKDHGAIIPRARNGFRLGGSNSRTVSSEPRERPFLISSRAPSARIPWAE